MRAPASLTSLAAAALVLGGCLESRVVECPWGGLYCASDQICHEELRSCVQPVQLTICEGKADTVSCQFSGLGPFVCRKGACVKPRCGDGVKDPPGEECDDRNEKDHDGCSKTCRRESLRWRRLPLTSGSPSPPARMRAALAYDPVARRILLFGGADTTARQLDDTWTLALERLSETPCDLQGTWSQQQPLSRPRARSSPAMVFDRSRARAVVFGGEVGPPTIKELVNDTWSFDGETWTPEAAARPLPSAVSGHQLVWDERRQRALLWGGEDAGGGFYLDLWALEGGAWHTVSTTTAGTSRLYLRTQHLMAYDAGLDQLFIAGGWCQQRNPLRDTWRLDLGKSTWESLELELRSPPVEAAAVREQLSGQLVLFGGRDEKTTTASARTYVLDPREVDPTLRGWQDGDFKKPLEQPGPRYGHSMVSLGAEGGVLLFGGASDSKGTLADSSVWVGCFQVERGCGNGIKESDGDLSEGCDGKDFGGLTCQALGYAGGALACSSTCQVLIDGCTAR